MGQMWIILLSITSLLLSCSITKSNDFDSQTELMNVKVLELNRFNTVNLIKSIKENSDTVFLISQKRREYPIDSSKFISLQLTPVTRFSVGTMEKLGAYLITGSDTLWSGPSITNAPKFYWIEEN